MTDELELVKEEYKDVKGSHRIARVLGDKKYEDLTGKKFGRLVAVKAIARNKGSRVLWLCKCECNNLYIGVASDLKANGVRSCGCLEAESRKKVGNNLEGKRFGKWTVLKEAGKGKVLCRCDCGTEKLVGKSNLLCGGSTSCGCERIKIIKEKFTENLIGQTFGYGTVIERADNKNGKVRWRLKCKCGNIYEASANSLKRMDSLSCGCYKRELIIKRCTKPMIGKTFGRLTVLEKVDPPKKGRGNYYLCSCSCGNKVVVQGSMLRSGNSRSCGCLLKEASKRFKDLSGQRFGKLTVIKRALNRNGDIRYECKCDCGGTVTVLADSLKANETISCGCVNSRGEYLISEVLKSNGIEFVKQKSYDDLRNGKHGILRFDFYIPSENYIIEFDGVQHFKSGSGWSTKENFEKVKRNDKLKNDYCASHGIPLIRIPFTHINEICIDDLKLNTTKFLHIND